MRPEEIKPDTMLCTILGYNAQTGNTRRYFNKWLKQNDINATAIALNITDAHFDFTMKSVGQSKVDKMILEQEFKESVLEYCQQIPDNCTSVDFVEIVDGEVIGYNLDEEVESLFENPAFVDDRMRFVAKMMIIAQRWYGVEVSIDDIPLIIEK